MVEEVTSIINTPPYTEDSADISESTSLGETGCHRKKYLIEPKNKMQCRLRRRVRNRRFLTSMLLHISTSSSDSDDTFTANESDDTQDSDESTSGLSSSSSSCKSSSSEHSDYSSSCENLLPLPTDSLDNSSYSTSASPSSSSYSFKSNNSKGSDTDTCSTESGCDSDSYDTLDTDDDYSSSE